MSVLILQRRVYFSFLCCVAENTFYSGKNALIFKFSICSGRKGNLAVILGSQKCKIPRT